MTLLSKRPWRLGRAAAIAIALTCCGLGGCSDDNQGTGGSGGEGGEGGGDGGDGGSPPLNCDAGTADCNGDPNDGCEVVLDSDAAHCGYCGHNCRETSCVSGACEPLVMWSNSAISDIAVTDTAVLWCTATRQVLTTPKGTPGGAVLFNSGNVQSSVRGRLRAEGDVVLYGTTPYLVRLEVGVPYEELTNSLNVRSLGFYGDDVVWWDGDDDELDHYAIAADARTSLGAFGLSGSVDVTVADGEVFATDGAGLQRITLADLFAETLFVGATRAPEVAGGYVYFVAQADDEPDRLMRVPLLGGAPEELFALDTIHAYAVDTAGAAVSSDDGIHTLHFGSGSEHVVYVHDEATDERPTHRANAMTLDAYRIYWSTSSSDGHQLASVGR